MAGRGKAGPEPDTAKREAFAALIAKGVPSARASRIVGINPRTGKRWRKGRKIVSSSGRVLEFAPVITGYWRTWSTSPTAAPSGATGCPRDDPRRVDPTAVRCVGRVRRHDGFMDGLTRLTDGVVVHRPLDLGDIAEHLAGEDEELVRWLNGGPGTHETVEAHARACMVAWQARGPMCTFSAQRHGVLEANSRRSSQCGVRPLALRTGFRLVDAAARASSTGTSETSRRFRLRSAWTAQSVMT